MDDFLFDYYPFSPGRLRIWHPGHGRTLEAEPSDTSGFPAGVYRWTSGQITLADEWLHEQQTRIATMVTYLESVHQRPARGGCHALHEWAMVLDTDQVRHERFALRVTSADIRATVDTLGLRCTHFDAFRFFTPAAQPLNATQPTRATQIDMDQPGCLHANMDLYKHAAMFAPVVGSTMVRECFQLARDIRTVDMQVAPYDLTSLGVTAIRIETPEGRNEFAMAQRGFADRASILRSGLIAAGRALLASR